VIVETIEMNLYSQTVPHSLVSAMRLWSKRLWLPCARNAVSGESTRLRTFSFAAAQEPGSYSISLSLTRGGLLDISGSKLNLGRSDRSFGFEDWEDGLERSLGLHEEGGLAPFASIFCSFARSHRRSARIARSRALSSALISS